MKRQTTIIAIANEKGGVAKTTSAINIAAGLSIRGKNVLLVDTDSQAHLSDWLGFTFDGKPTISEYIYQTVAKFEVKPADFIRRNDKFAVDYIPATKKFAGAISTLRVDIESTTVLKRIFDNEYFENYDFIIIDCGPTLDLRVTNALVSSDMLLVPVQTDYMAYTGTDKILNKFLCIKPTADINNDVIILPTMYHRNTTISKEILQALNESYGNIVMNPIPYRTSAINSSAEKNVLVRRKKDDVGIAYMNVVDYLIGGENNE